MGLGSVFKKVTKKVTKSVKKVGGAARSVGRGARRAARGARKAAGSVGSSGFNVVKEAANRVAGLPEAALGAVGARPLKKLRLRVVVLAGDDRRPVTGTSPADVRSAVRQAVDVADELFRREAKFKIVAAGGRLGTLDSRPAPPAARRVRCDSGALRDDLTAAGKFFRGRAASNVVGTVIGAGAPLTAFVVEDVVDKAGCSLGPLTDYVTIDDGGLGRRRTLAHEISHALGLPHTGGMGGAISGGSGANLMTSSRHGENLNDRQVLTVRNSRHVTFL